MSTGGLVGTKKLITLAKLASLPLVMVGKIEATAVCLPRVVWDMETWDVDGFGRVVAHAVSVDDEAKGYLLKTVETLEYRDHAVPNQVIQRRRVDFGDDSAWVTTEQSFDGFGRVLAERALRTQGADAVTTYLYDGVGNLEEMRVPDPRVEDGSNQVSYRFAHDALGRTTHFVRPDGTGIEIVYDGLRKTVTEILGGGERGATTEALYDVFGRLLEVVEDAGDGEEHVSARTTYTYDVHDNLETVIDADGNVTSLEHDWTSNRTAIERQGRVWRYAYDLNGNLASETLPHAEGALPELFKTTYLYDVMGRLTKKVVAPKKISVVPTVGMGETTTYTYDQGQNGKGRLSRVDLPFGRTTYAYQAGGQVSLEIRQFRVTYLDEVPKGALESEEVYLTQWVHREYNALGLPVFSKWDHGETWSTEYDERGLVRAVRHKGKAVALYARNPAGVPYRRDTDFGQTRRWTFDALGRVKTDTVTTGGGTPHERAYFYTPAGNLMRVEGTTNGGVPYRV